MWITDDHVSLEEQTFGCDKLLLIIVKNTHPNTLDNIEHLRPIQRAVHVFCLKTWTKTFPPHHNSPANHRKHYDALPKNQTHNTEN